MRMNVQESFFYTDGRMVASTNLGRNETTFGMLTGLFDRVGLQTNVLKTAEMVFQSYRGVRVRLDESYTQQMTGTGRSYNEIQRGRVSCLSSGRTWRGGHWMRTAKNSKAWQRGIQEKREKEKSGSTILGLTGWRLY